MLEEVKEATNNLEKAIEFAEAYCLKNRMILVRVDVPPLVYQALKAKCYNLKPEFYALSHFDIEQLCGVPISINENIRKPQYIMEYNGDE